MITLGEHGYDAEGKKAEVQRNDIIPLMEDVLPIVSPGMSKEEWKEALRQQKGSGVRHEVFNEAVNRGLSDGRWISEGKRPVRYRRSSEQVPLHSYVAPDADPEALEIPFEKT